MGAKVGGFSLSCMWDGRGWASWAGGVSTDLLTLPSVSGLSGLLSSSIDSYYPKTVKMRLASWDQLLWPCSLPAPWAAAGVIRNKNPRKKEGHAPDLGLREIWELPVQLPSCDLVS